MADRNFLDVRTFGRNRVCITGSFAPNNTSAVDASSNKGKGFTVARASAGVFTVTLDATLGIPYVDSVVSSLSTNAAAALFAQNGAYSTSARTFSIRLVNGSGSATDLAANANNRVNFEIIGRMSSEE